MSMKPGATAHPDASSSRSPRRFGPISTIAPPAIATSAARPGAPLPSTTVPPRMTISADMRSSLSAIGGVDHDLEQVPVRIPHVHARPERAAAAMALHRTLLDLRARLVQLRLQRFRRAVPHEAE